MPAVSVPGVSMPGTSASVGAPGMVIPQLSAGLVGNIAAAATVQGW